MFRKLLIVAFCLCPSVAFGTDDAQCYFLLTTVPAKEPFTIRVVYASGHSITVGAGDYLPVGCNVDHYEYVGGTGTQQMRAVGPCELTDYYLQNFYPNFWATRVDTGGAQMPLCHDCGDCEPYSGGPGGGGTDTDGDGLPDGVDDDDDDDGIPDDEDDDDDGDGIPDVNDPDHPDYSGEPPCDPLEECCPEECCPGDPGYPDCEEVPDDDCPDCDPCEKLDAMMALMLGWNSNLGAEGGVRVNLGTPTGSAPSAPAYEVEPEVDTYGVSLPDNTIPTSFGNWTISVPIPNNPAKNVLATVNPAHFNQGLSGLTGLTNNVNLVRTLLRGMLVVLVHVHFVRKIFGLFGSL